MIYYVALLMLFCCGFFLTRKKGLSYPMNAIMGALFLYFVVKYFAYYFLDIPPLCGLSLNDLASAGGNLLLFFGAVNACFYACKLLLGKLRPIRWEFTERVNFGALSYLAMAGLLGVVAEIGGSGALAAPLQARNIMSLQGMAYLSIVMQFVTTYYSCRLLYDGKYSRLLFFSVVFSAFAFVSGRASLQVSYMLNLLFFANACYHRRIIGYCALAAMIGIPYVVITGVYRDVTRLGGGSWSQMGDALESGLGGNAIETEVTLTLYRIDDLEELALLSNALDRGELKPQFGSELADELYQWMPRHFVSGKPLNFTMWMTRWFHPRVYYVAEAGNNFTGVGELLFNFGLAGALGGGLFVGLVMYWACAMWDASRDSFGMSILQFTVIQPYVGLGMLAGFVNDLALPTLLVTLLAMALTVRVDGVDTVRQVARSLVWVGE